MKYVRRMVDILRTGELEFCRIMVERCLVSGDDSVMVGGS